MHLLNIAHDIFLIPHSEVGIGSAVFLAANDVATSLPLDFSVAFRLVLEFGNGRSLGRARVADNSHCFIRCLAASGLDVARVSGAAKKD